MKGVDVCALHELADVEALLAHLLAKALDVLHRRLEGALRSGRDPRIEAERDLASRPRLAVEVAHKLSLLDMLEERLPHGFVHGRRLACELHRGQLAIHKMLACKLAVVSAFRNGSWDPIGSYRIQTDPIGI